MENLLVPGYAMETSVILPDHYLKASALYATATCPKCGERKVFMKHGAPTKRFRLWCLGCGAEGYINEDQVNVNDVVSSMILVVEQMLGEKNG